MKKVEGNACEIPLMRPIEDMDDVLTALIMINFGLDNIKNKITEDDMKYRPSSKEMLRTIRNFLDLATEMTRDCIKRGL